MSILNGKYVGDLSPEEVVKQFEFRISIHETYIGLVLDDPDKWSGFGSAEFHYWAINGYEFGIKYIKWNNPVKCSQSEAFRTIFKMILNLFRG